MKKYPMKAVDKLLWVLELLAAATFIVMMLMLNLLPDHFMMALVLFLTILTLILFLMFYRKKSRIAARIISIILSAILGVGSFFVYTTNSIFTDISSANMKIDEVAIIVLTDDTATDVADLQNYQVGILELLDRTNTDDTLTHLDEVGVSVNTTEYVSADTLVDALYSGEVQAIILNEGYREMVVENVSESFSTDTRVVSNWSFETEVEVSASSKEDFDITSDTFTVYISGIDVYGSISTTSRTDVNILATVNPTTEQVLLTTTPRDYYVQVPTFGNAYDKLTHTGIYGVDVSIETLEQLYDIEIDYYLRVNFTSLENIVDALGGITVDSDVAFSYDGYSFSYGENFMYGEAALAFSRARSVFSTGDVQRGLNQMAVIEGIIDKMISPSIISGYSSLLESVSGCMETSMTTDEISQLVKMQLEDGASWDIISTNVTGSDAYRSTYSLAGSYYVMLQDDDEIAAAKARFEQIYNNEYVSES